MSTTQLVYTHYTNTQQAFKVSKPSFFLTRFEFIIWLTFFLCTIRLRWKHTRIAHKKSTNNSVLHY